MSWLVIKTAEDVAAEALTAHRTTIAAAVDARIEAQARALGYNSAARLAGYANSTVPAWKAEAEAFIAWADQTWLAVFDAEAEAQLSGIVPELDAVLADLPEWVAPAE